MIRARPDEDATARELKNFGKKVDTDYRFIPASSFLDERAAESRCKQELAAKLERELEFLATLIFVWPRLITINKSYTPCLSFLG